MAAEQDDILQAISEHTGAVDKSFANVNATISTLSKQLGAEVAFRTELERKLNMLRAGVGTVTSDGVDHAAQFSRAIKSWYPQRAAELGNFDYGEYCQGFSKYLRYGIDSLSIDQRKAMLVGSETDGGILVPSQLASEIIRIERDNSPLRGVCRVLTMGSADLEFPVTLTRPAVGWVGETQSRPATATGKIGSVTFTARELFCMPEATQKLIDDSSFDIEAFMAEEIGLAFAEEEDQQFISGDGIEKPRGFTTYPVATTADSTGTRPHGTIQYIPTGVGGNWPATDSATYDLLVSVIHSLRPRYRRNASWIMGTEALAKLRKLKDDQKQPYWQPSMTEGQPERLLGFPIVEAEQMPGIGADSLSVAFGDWQRAYWIVDRTGIRLLRDPYTNKPYIRWYTSKRVAGAVADSNALKLIKFAAS